MTGESELLDMIERATDRETEYVNIAYAYQDLTWEFEFLSEESGRKLASFLRREEWQFTEFRDEIAKAITISDLPDQEKITALTEYSQLGKTEARNVKKTLYLLNHGRLSWRLLLTEDFCSVIRHIRARMAKK